MAAFFDKKEIYSFRYSLYCWKKRVYLAITLCHADRAKSALYSGISDVMGGYFV
jgi:hypothetical protein